MFSLLKKLIIFGLMSVLKCNIIKNISGNFEIFTPCYLLPNEECKIIKVIADNDYVTYVYKISLNRCIGSFIDKGNPYFKVCLPNSIENITIKSFDLLTKKNVLKNILLLKTCKCGCLLDEKVCNNKQKWNNKKCRCECLEQKMCFNNTFFNVINCRCEMKKAVKLIVESKRLPKECKEINDNVIIQNKKITLVKKIKQCKPFIGVSILFVFISLIIVIYVCLKSKKTLND